MEIVHVLVLLVGLMVVLLGIIRFSGGMRSRDKVGTTTAALGTLIALASLIRLAVFVFKGI